MNKFVLNIIGNKKIIHEKPEEIRVSHRHSPALAPGASVVNFVDKKVDSNKVYYVEEKPDMNPFIKFMASTAGRAARVAAGLVLILWGSMGIGGTTGAVVAVIGLVPLVAGLFDFCLFAPLFGAPLSGPQIRSAK